MRETPPRPAAVKPNGFPPDQLRTINDEHWSFVIHSSSASEASPSRLTITELVFIAGLASVILIGWAALVLAQFDSLSRSGLLLILASVAAVMVGLGVLRILDYEATLRDTQDARRKTQDAIPRPTWHAAMLAGLLVIAAILYIPPADYAPAFLDAGWYRNTGALIARTGALIARPSVLEELPTADRELFVRTYHDVRASMPRFPDRRDLGFYNLVFAIDLGRGRTVVPYHPPFASVWIAVLRLVGGPAMGAYAAPLFGLLFVLAVYAAGCAIFGRNIALAGAFLIALSPPVVYYARTPFAELLAGALIWAGVYALTRYAVTSGGGPKSDISPDPGQRIRSHRAIQPSTRTPGDAKPCSHGTLLLLRSSTPLPPCSPAPLLLLAGLAFGAALLTKIESLLLLPPIALFWLIWLHRRWATRGEFAAFLAPFGILAGHAGLLYATVLRPYTILNGYGIWSMLIAALRRPAVWGALTGLYLLGIIVLLTGRRFGQLEIRDWRLMQSPFSILHSPFSILQPAVSLVILAGAGVALLLAWPVTQANSSSTWSALVALGLFLTPLGLGLGLVGLSTLVADDLSRRTAFLVMLLGTAGLATILMPAISSNVSYLYTIRRQLPVVVPALLLLTGYVTLRWAGLSESDRRSSHPSAALRRGVVILVLALVIFNFLDASRSLIQEQELAGASAFVARLAHSFKRGDIVLFESVDRGAHVGRFATPLWAEHGISAMLLSSSYPPQGRLTAVIQRWQAQGRRVYFVSQSQPPLFTLLDFEWQLVDERAWAGSTIAAKMTFPPESRVVEVPFYIYEIRARRNWQQHLVP
jgi:hypothetical protein